MRQTPWKQFKTALALGKTDRAPLPSSRSLIMNPFDLSKVPGVEVLILCGLCLKRAASGDLTIDDVALPICPVCLSKIQENGGKIDGLDNDSSE